MKTSDNGIELIKSFEGFSPKACKCVDTEKYYTIGYGHYGKDVNEKDTITKSAATELLKKDVECAERKVDKYNSIYNFNQNQFDALVSFCYNVGNIDGLTKNGTRLIGEISRAFLYYNKSGGKVLSGLQKRRKKEKDLFDSLIECNTYYPRYNGNSSNIDIVLKSIGVPDKYIGSWSCRKYVAYRNGITNYVGSLYDNIKIMELAKSGKLKK